MAFAAVIPDPAPRALMLHAGDGDAAPAWMERIGAAPLTAAALAQGDESALQMLRAAGCVLVDAGTQGFVGLARRVPMA